MSTLNTDTARYASSLTARGVFLVFLGISAISWPDGILVYAMLIAAFLLAAFGVHEMLLAFRSRRTTRGWLVPLANGAACIEFAILTLAFPSLPLRTTLLLVAAWLLMYSTLTGTLALALWPMRRTRRVLLAWTGLNIVLAMLAVFAPNTTIFTILYVGAGYAVALGALQLASGVWVRRVAVSHTAPLTQSTWSAPVPHPRVAP